MREPAERQNRNRRGRSSAPWTGILFVIVAGAAVFSLSRGGRTNSFHDKFMRVNGEMDHEDVEGLFGKTWTAFGAVLFERPTFEEPFRNNWREVAHAGVFWQFDEGRTEYAILFDAENRVVYKAIQKLGTHGKELDWL